MPLHSSQLHMVGLLHTPPPWCSSAMIGAPQSPSALLNPCRRSSVSNGALIFHSALLTAVSHGAPQSPPRPRIGAPLFHSRLVTSVPFQRCSAWMGCSAGYVLLNPRRRSLAWIFAPEFHSALRHHHQHSPCPPRTPHQALLLSWWRTWFSPEFVIFAFQSPF